MNTEPCASWARPLPLAMSLACRYTADSRYWGHLHTDLTFSSAQSVIDWERSIKISPPVCFLFSPFLLVTAIITNALTDGSVSYHTAIHNCLYKNCLLYYLILYALSLTLTDYLIFGSCTCFFCCWFAFSCHFCPIFFFLVFGGTGVELRSSLLLGRWSMT
jgi:hypothetical protein